jgi:hypothetical protein
MAEHDADDQQRAAIGAAGFSGIIGEFDQGEAFPLRSVSEILRGLRLHLLGAISCAWRARCHSRATSRDIPARSAAIPRSCGACR